MKGKHPQPGLFYLARLSCRFAGKMKNCTEKQKLKDFGPTKPALQEMLKELLSEKKKGTARNMKITKAKSLPVKANIQ